ncbi:MAG: ABC transporter substrate-binding protein [Clostridia bacterium]|nr:ABC transporter substrate-binding protein [Clostridia bacterium]
MKRILALLVAVVMCASMFVGCGSKDDGNTLKIGGIGPITGDAAIYGQAVMNGCKIAVDEINAAGGIGGLQIEFKFEDDVNVAETSVTAYNKLMDWGMDILVGTVTTTPCISVSEKIYEDRVFALTPSASSTDVTKGKDNMFQLCFSDPNQGTGSATYISANMADKKIAVIYRNDDAYSQGIRDTFVAEANAKNLSIVYEGTFTADTATDFSVQLTAAKAAKADLIFLPIYYQPASVILAQAKAMDYAPTFFGVDGMDGILTMKNFDTKLAEGVMVLTPFSADAQDDRTVNFVKKYKELYKEVPNQFAADGYDCIYAVKAAYEKAGCTKDMKAEELCAALVKAIKEISFDGLTGTSMTWSDKGEVNKMPTAVVIKDGVYVSAEAK